MTDLTLALETWETFLDRDEGIPIPVEEDNAQVGFVDHGVNSRRFVCRFTLGHVAFDCEVFFGGLDPETCGTAQEEALDCVRLALIVIHSEQSGFQWNERDPAATLLVQDEDGRASYRIACADGSVTGGEGWQGLLRVLRGENREDMIPV